MATAMVGYRTYPHIDMAATGKRAAELLDRLLKEKRPVYRAYRQLDFLIPLVWQCTFIEPAKSIFDLVGELEAGEKSHNQGIVSVTHTPGFPPADIAQCGPALVGLRPRQGSGRSGGRQARPDGEGAGEGVRRRAARSRRRGTARHRAFEEREEADRARRRAGQSRRRRHLDTVGLLAALMRAQGQGRGDRHDRRRGGRARRPSPRARATSCIAASAPSSATPARSRSWPTGAWSRSATASSPAPARFYGGARFQIGPMALVTDEASGVSAVLASQAHPGGRPGDVPPCRRRARPKVPILGLKSTVHFRADFQPIAETILVRAVARRAHHRSGRDALQAPAQGHQAQADGTGVERRIVARLFRTAASRRLMRPARRRRSGEA